MNDEFVAVPKTALVGVIEYLAKRPYAEVAQGIGVLSQALQAYEQSKKPEEKTD